MEGIADISQFTALQTSQNERFANSIDSAFAGFDPNYTEFRGNLRKPKPAFSGQQSEKTQELAAMVEQAKQNLRACNKELKRVYTATLRTEKSTTDPEKVAEYTGVQQGEPGWVDAVETYRRDLYQNTFPQYNKKAKDAWEDLQRITKEWYDSVDKDRQAEGHTPLVHSRDEIAETYYGMNPQVVLRGR